MEDFFLDLPDILFKPEELERYNKFKSDITAFYDEHGEHLQWLQQAADLGLMDTTEPTPDEITYMNEVARIAEENNMSDIEGYDQMMAARYRFNMLNHFKQEAQWIMQIAMRKKVESGKNLISYLSQMLDNVKNHVKDNPQDDEVMDAFDKLAGVVEKMRHDVTLTELRLNSAEQSSDN
ncbi:MAG: hypothetical protein JNL70_24795 [Saprospiraceae bacterium]|nr:hypothetical protein [Saprospiraceae bacterium]